MSKVTYIIVLLSLFSFSVLIGACREERKFKEFFDLSLTKRHEEFQKFPIEKQLDVYIYALERIHPPDISFADDIASQGEKNIPFLMDKLSKENDEGRQEKILLIFEMMVSIRKYELRNNHELIELLKKVVSSMKFPAIKEATEESLQIILQGPKTSN